MTMRVAREAPYAKFMWPADTYDFNKHLSVALRHLPPDHFASIANRYAMPDRFKRARARNAPKARLPAEEIIEVYHGANPFTVPQIWSQGLRGTNGTAWERVAQVYGVHVPLAYVSKKFSTAAYYPAVGYTGP